MKRSVFISISLVVLFVLIYAVFAKDTGTIKIECKKGTFLMLDNEFYGISTKKAQPIFIIDVPTGEHVLVGHIKNKKSIVEKLNIPAGDTVSVVLEFKSGNSYLRDEKYREFEARNNSAIKDPIVPYKPAQ